MAQYQSSCLDRSKLLIACSQFHPSHARDGKRTYGSVSAPARDSTGSNIKLSLNMRTHCGRLLKRGPSPRELRCCPHVRLGSHDGDVAPTHLLFGITWGCVTFVCVCVCVLSRKHGRHASSCSIIVDPPASDCLIWSTTGCLRGWRLFSYRCHGLSCQPRFC